MIFNCQHQDVHRTLGGDDDDRNDVRGKEDEDVVELAFTNDDSHLPLLLSLMMAHFRLHAVTF